MKYFFPLAVFYVTPIIQILLILKYIYFFQKKHKKHHLCATSLQQN